MLQGHPAHQYEDFDTYNDEEVARKAPLSLAEIARQLDDTHSRLLAAINSVPDQRWDNDPAMQEHIQGESYSHYREHYQQIQEWRKANGV